MSRYSAPSIAAFGEICLTRERQGRRSFSQGQGRAFENPRQKREAQDLGGIRVSFLFDTFLWTSKEKYLARRCENRLKIKPVAIATLIRVGFEYAFRFAQHQQHKV